MPPLTVPLVPAPLDQKTQAVLDAKKPRLFMVQLKHVAPSLMAHWLNPQNHPASSLPTATTGSDIVLQRVPPLPKDIGMLIAIDNDKHLFVYGTLQAFQELQATIASLDSPTQTASVSFSAKMYWIDSLTSSAKDNKLALAQLRAALPGEVEALDQLATQDRAFLQTLPTPEVNGAIAFLSFAPNGFEQPQSKLRSMTPPFFNPEIDPGMPILPTKSSPLLERSTLHLVPTLNPQGELVIASGGQGVLASTAISNGEFILSGATSSFQLKAPSPRFDSFVLVITPHLRFSFPQK